jgi:hypothetical protein
MVGYEDRSRVLVLATPTQQGRSQVRHKVQDPPLVPRTVAAPAVQARR